MDIQSVKVVYFSPTGTTKSVVQGIASGITPNAPELIDITKPAARTKQLHVSDKDLLIIGVPVYMGRVPTLLDEWLNTIQADNTPTVCVVVYGNRVYDDALLELKDTVKKRGGVPIAGAAYIGEHSFSNSEAPTALGRPDDKDLLHAKEFGQKIREKMQSVTSPDQFPDMPLPGSYPYGGVTQLWDVDFIEVSDTCTQCGACAKACPMDAVDPQNSSIIDHEKCITCCACIKKCPQNARTMKPGPVLDARHRLFKLFNTPLEPETFL